MNEWRRRLSLARRYLAAAYSVTDWPAALQVAAGAAALKPGRFQSDWASNNLPKIVTLRLKRFGKLRVSLKPADWTHQNVLPEFIFENAYNLDLVPFNPTQIIDCGAHAGFFLRLCRNRYPETPIIAFEPQIGNAPLACDVPPSRLLTMHQAAVGAEDGTVVFDDGALRGFGLIAPGSNSSAPGAHSVPLVSLPRVLASSSDRLLLKIDIEGAERELIPKSSIAPGKLRVLPGNAPL